MTDNQDNGTPAPVPVLKPIVLKTEFQDIKAMKNPQGLIASWGVLLRNVVLPLPIRVLKFLGAFLLMVVALVGVLVVLVVATAIILAANLLRFVGLVVAGLFGYNTIHMTKESISAKLTKAMREQYKEQGLDGSGIEIKAEELPDDYLKVLDRNTRKAS